MAFKAIAKTNEKRDCRDFKPYFFDKRYCKYSFKCANAGNEYIIRRHYDLRGFFDLRCTGIEKKKITILPKADPEDDEVINLL